MKEKEEDGFFSFSGLGNPDPTTTLSRHLWVGVRYHMPFPGGEKNAEFELIVISRLSTYYIFSSYIM